MNEDFLLDFLFYRIRSTLLSCVGLRRERERERDWTVHCGRGASPNVRITVVGNTIEGEGASVDRWLVLLVLLLLLLLLLPPPLLLLLLIF